jgi:Rad3-related DNA helicase
VLMSRGTVTFGSTPELADASQAHNIDNVCIEALSVELDERTLEKASRSLGRISTEVRHRCTQSSHSS